MICFLYIDGALAVHEDLMGLYTCDNTTKIRLVNVLEDVMIRLDLKLANRSQCSDGGSNIAGSTS